MLTNREAADWRRCEGTVSGVDAEPVPGRGAAPARPRPGPHPGNQAPANQESISI